jgi:hypothetical protein
VSASSGRTAWSSATASSGVAIGSQQLRDDEAGLEDLARLVCASGHVGVLHIEAQLRERLTGLADLGIGVAPESSGGI